MNLSLVLSARTLRFLRSVRGEAGGGWRWDSKASWEDFRWRDGEGRGELGWREEEEGWRIAERGS